MPIADLSTTVTTNFSNQQAADSVYNNAFRNCFNLLDNDERLKYRWITYHWPLRLHGKDQVGCIRTISIKDESTTHQRLNVWVCVSDLCAWYGITPHQLIRYSYDKAFSDLSAKNKTYTRILCNLNAGGSQNIQKRMSDAMLICVNLPKMSLNSGCQKWVSGASTAIFASYDLATLFFEMLARLESIFASNLRQNTKRRDNSYSFYSNYARIAGRAIYNWSRLARVSWAHGYSLPDPVDFRDSSRAWFNKDSSNEYFSQEMDVEKIRDIYQQFVTSAATIRKRKINRLVVSAADKTAVGAVGRIKRYRSDGYAYIPSYADVKAGSNYACALIRAMSVQRAKPSTQHADKTVQEIFDALSVVKEETQENEREHGFAGESIECGNVTLSMACSEGASEGYERSASDECNGASSGEVAESEDRELLPTAAPLPTCNDAFSFWAQPEVETQ